MKTSELIKTLQHCLDSYGDTKVCLSISIPKDLEPEARVFQETNIFVNYMPVDYNERIGQDVPELSIQNFPY